MRTSLSAGSGQCADGWESFNGTCYYFSHDTLNWTASRERCVSDGGHLVIIDSWEEQVLVTMSLSNFCSILPELNRILCHLRAHTSQFTSSTTDAVSSLNLRELDKKKRNAYGTQVLMKMSEEVVYSAVKLKSNREPENTVTKEQRKENEHIGDIEYGAVTFRRNEMNKQRAHPKGGCKYLRLAVGTLFTLLISVAILLCIMFAGSVAGQCTDGWESFNGTCYYFSPDTLNWTASRDRCVSDGGRLVIIDSWEEQIYISRKLSNHTKDEFWIGLTDSEKEGHWKWVDNTDLNLMFWHKGQPNNQPSGVGNKTYTSEDCGIVRHVQQDEHNWFDKYCGSVVNRICEAQF
ncbi:low affinity immunoglobulin epsilon Fc receptor-like [Sardina pilchardus]|uniref:low affinity immunoglobulin epsilon Fc receptor-like n=1 Tax=Sardina pilchardus TaxID=27697 RepID=UPI002E153930